LQNSKKRFRNFDRNLVKSSGYLAPRIQESIPSCWFCDTEAIEETKEHVIPKWLQTELSVARQKIKPVRILSDFQTVGSERSEFDLSSLTIGNVCRTCNNGWKGTIETLAREPLISDLKGHISLEHGEILARWFTKTAICLILSMPYRLLFDAGARHSLSDKMPKSVQIFIYKPKKIPMK
jgi:hypothetical protein